MWPAFHFAIFCIHYVLTKKNTEMRTSTKMKWSFEEFNKDVSFFYSCRLKIIAHLQSKVGSIRTKNVSQKIKGYK